MNERNKPKDTIKKHTKYVNNLRLNNSINQNLYKKDIPHSGSISEGTADSANYAVILMIAIICQLSSDGKESFDARGTIQRESTTSTLCMETVYHSLSSPLIAPPLRLLYPPLRPPVHLLPVIHP